MGVCGCGKTEVGLALAALTGGVFHDADHFHSAENIAKMGRGEPLRDADRWPWLRRMRDDILAPAIAAPATGEPASGAAGHPVILGCSALRRMYREALVEGLPGPGIRFVHLHGPEQLILERMRARKGHYMKEGMVASQFAILEPPGMDENAIAVPIDQAPEAIAREIVARLRCKASTTSG